MQHESDSGHQHGHGKSNIWALSLTALGVVDGDIGTSPLYALKECFNGPHGIEISTQTVFGVLSLVFWALVIVISIKYMAFVLRADNRGEGGILALTSLACPQKLANSPYLLLGLGIFGASLLYGDGVITPAITVLSAIEGLTVATHLFEPWVVPIAIVILVTLFYFQNHGTARIGAVFGPVMMLWFTVLAALGINGILQYPAILGSLNPYYAFDFFIHHKLEAYFVMGAVFLAVTGGEALYADMGHFGKNPIRRAWFIVVLPGLMLNYLGQGAMLITNPATKENPFYLMAPSWMLYPLVVLATLASVIASQALISGVFSLSRQAIQLGLSPRMQIIHTSRKEIGQIYLPQMNWALLIGCIYLVITFKSSSGLAAAYGFSVATDMVITTILMFVVARKVWGWNLALAVPVMLFFLVVDLIFFSANIIKIPQGGYVPLIIGTVIFTLMSTWRRGRQILAERLRNSVIHLDKFLKQIQVAGYARVPGAAVYMVGDPATTPPAMVHNVKHNKVVHELVVILTLITKEIPTVAGPERVKIERIEESIYRVIAKYGFTETPDVMEIMKLLSEAGVPIEVDKTTFFLGRETLIASENPGMAIWREHLFSFMSRNAQRATAFFNIPANQVIEVGIQVEI